MRGYQLSISHPIEELLLSHALVSAPNPTNPNADRFQYHARDTGSDLRWGCFGSGAETTLTHKNPSFYRLCICLLSNAYSEMAFLFFLLLLMYNRMRAAANPTKTPAPTASGDSIIAVRSVDVGGSVLRSRETFARTPAWWK